MNEQWYSIVEYARTFSISDMTVRRHIKTGKIKAVMKDGKYYIPVSRSHLGQSMCDSTPSEQRKPAVDSPSSSFVEQSAMPLQVLKGSPHNRSQGAPINSLSAIERIVVPPHITSTLKTEACSGDNSKELLDYCSKSLEKLADREKHIEEKFLHKVESLELVIATKDLEIKGLKQTVEDLQLLVRIFEKKHA